MSEHTTPWRVVTADETSTTQWIGIVDANNKILDLTDKGVLNDIATAMNWYAEQQG